MSAPVLLNEGTLRTAALLLLSSYEAFDGLFDDFDDLVQTCARREPLICREMP